MSKLLSAIPVVGGILSNAFNANQQKKQNERSEKFSREMYGKQRADALSDFHMQNAYNDPAAQMQRLKGAGLNPNLVYGTGADAQSTAPVRSSQASQPNFKAPQVDAGGIAFMGLQMKQMQANIARTEAETNAINTRNVGTDFQNQVNTAIGADLMAQKYQAEYKKLSQQQKSEMVDLESKLGALELDKYPMGDKNNIATKAAKAGYERTIQELENAKQRGDALAAEAAIKQFEKRLTDQGISPNSPYYLKTIMSLLEKVGISIPLN